ncbi:MAG: XRE family transcriptional regulator [Gammaproteobacteria bacterium]|nr:XRE family transcriptional regulator [Gammaproteobacteria bacterium]
MDSVGQWIRQTRITKGFSLQRLAESVEPKVTVEELRNFENGRVIPSRSALVEFGRALDVSIEVFMRSPVVDLHLLEYRKPPQITERQCMQAESAFQDMLERYLTIEQILELDPQVSWRKKLGHAKLMNWEDVEAKAEALRSIWKLGAKPIPSMCELLEENGFKILEQDVPKHIDGLACQAEVLNNGWRVVDIVLVSSRVNIEQKRFTLAHELAHQIIPSTGNPEFPSTKARERFAGAFLVPKPALLNVTGTSNRLSTSDEILSLKRKYGVPASCILMRLGHVGIFAISAVETAFQTYARSWLESEPEPLDSSDKWATLEKPSRFKRLVSQALTEKLISSDRAKSLLSKLRWHGS